MSMPQLVQGSFVSDGLPKVLDIQAGALYFKLTNVTAGQEYEWYKGFAADTAYDVTGSALISSGGISAFQSAENAFGPEKVGTAVSQAASAVVTMNAHGFLEGDVVRLYGTTGMRQIAGMLFKVKAPVNANDFAIDLDSSGFAAAATAVKARKLLVPQLFEPRARYVVALGLGASTTVTCSEDHGYQVGQYVTLQVPAVFGSVEINGKSGRISSVPASNQFVVEIDSAAATAFAFPSSGSVPISFAMVEPAGSQYTLSQGNVFFDSSVNVGVRGLALGATVVGSAADEIYYYALA